MSHPRPLSSLNLLRAFEAAARLGSFREAGDELCVTASAVSQQVRSLEEQLGVDLFRRHARGLTLTEAGQRYAAEIRPLLAGLDDATRRARQGRQRTLLRVSMLPPLASRVVLPRLADFQARHPDIDLRLDTRLDNVNLAQGQADLAIRYGAPPWAGCVHETLADVFLQAICPNALARELDLPRQPGNLLRLPLVHMTGRPDSWPLYFAQLGLGAPMPPHEYHVDDYPAAVEAAETLGAALALLPLERPLIDSGRVTAVGPALGPLPEAIHAVMRPGQQASPAIRAFLDWLRDALASLA